MLLSISNFDNVKKTRKDSLGILNLTGNATERKVKANYRKIAQIHHPDKHCLASTGMSPRKVEEYFKLVNNAHKCLCMNA